MAAGDFSASSLQIFQAMLKKEWQGALATKEYQANTGFFEALATQHNAKVDKVFQGNENICLGVKLAWQKTKPIVATVTTVSNLKDPVCDFEGEQGESDSTIYKMDKRIEASFEVEDNDCPNLIEKSAMIAERTFEAKKAIKNALNNVSCASILANLGKNLYSQAGGPQIATLANNGTLTKINPGNFNYIDFPSYLTMLRTFNKYESPILIDGFMLTKAIEEAKTKSGTSAGDMGQMGAFSKVLSNYVGLPLDYADMIENGIGVTFNDLFLIEKGAPALAFHNVNSATPTQRNANGGTIRLLYQDVLDDVTFKGKPVVLDVQYKETEKDAGSGTCKIVHTWHFSLHFNVFWTPQYQVNGVSDGRTGAIKIVSDSNVSKVTNPFFPTYS